MRNFMNLFYHVVGGLNENYFNRNKDAECTNLDHFRPFGTIWDNLGPFGNIWDYLGVHPLLLGLQDDEKCLQSPARTTGCG